MSDETVVKDCVIEAPAGDVVEEVAATVTEPLKVVTGRVVIDVTATGINVEAPQNLLIAFAVLNAGRVWLESQYAKFLQDATAKQPKIIAPGSVAGMEGMMKRLGGRPS